MSEMKPVTAVAVVAVLFGGFGTFCTIWVFRLLEQDRLPSMFVVAGFAVFGFAILAVRVFLATGSVSPRIDYGDAGTVLRPDPKVDRLSATAVLAGFAAMLLYAAGAPFGVVALPGIADQRWYALASAIGVVIGVPSLARIARHRGMGYLRLTPDGVEHVDPYSRVERRWDELTEVSDQPRQQNWLQMAGSTYVTTSDGRTRTLTSDWYTPGGHALRELMRFYWQHPDHRVELTDGRAARRLVARAEPRGG